MGLRSNVVINDSSAVAHTFSPNSGDGNVPGVSVIEYEDRSGGIMVGFPKIQIATRRPSKTNRNSKITVKVWNPVLETVSNSTVSGIAPAPTVAYSCAFTGEFIIPERSTSVARADMLAFVKNLLQTAVVTSAIENLESPF